MIIKGTKRNTLEITTFKSSSYTFNSYTQDEYGIIISQNTKGLVETPKDELGVPKDESGVPKDELGVPKDELGVPKDYLLL